MTFRDIKPIIAITGSAGKTMVKAMLSSILREKWVIFESKDYYNTVEKTKLHATQINYIHRAAVLEYGMASPGAITEHCRIIEPNVGVITNVGLAHIENFNGKVELLAAAKSELIKGMNQNGILFLNADDQNSHMLDINGFKGTIFTVSINNKSDYMAYDINNCEDGITFKLVIRGTEYLFRIPVLGRHNVYNAVFAIAVSDQLGFTPAEMINGLMNVKKPNHRLDIIHLNDNITIIDDTVHAHPPAMKAAIDVLAEISNGRTIAVLGQMPALGMQKRELHEDVGRYVAAHKIDYLYTYCSYSSSIGAGAISAGLPAEKVKHWEVSQLDTMHKALLDIIVPGTTVLVKGGSRLNMYETVCYLCNYYKTIQTVID